ncbi:MAG TPA: 2-oxoglutarate and iron-dependent oxygenase domain-containing protein [Trebonia sp.]|nr:2-oxoglutarate and iron-dependent oxygenase domain-containing protein [Trebonia sp.]
MTTSFPIIDLRELEEGSQRQERLAELRHTVHEIGFFYLVGHGARGAEELLDQVRQFFSLPEAEKLQLSILNSPHFRGYSDLAREITDGKADGRQQLDVGPEYPDRVIGLDEPHYRWLAGPNQWPASLPGLQPVVLDWIAQMTVLGGRMLRLILEALETPRDYLDDLIEPNPHPHFKLLHYPGPGPDDPRVMDQGVGIHRDQGLLTFVLQDHHGGLQVEVEPGQFEEVSEIPGTLVVNLGELLEVATRGYLRATTHRVVRPPSGVHRYSAGLFYNPRLEATMRSLPSPYVTASPGVIHNPDNPLFEGYGDNVMKGMCRGFPDVVARHHPQWLVEA